MKKILLFCMFLAILGMLIGWEWDWEWEDDEPGYEYTQIDMTCLQDCIDLGYGGNYCQKACSF